MELELVHKCDVNRAEWTLKKIARRAAIVFAAEGWTWYGTKHVPNAIGIEDAIRGDITRANIKDIPSGSGRLIVYRNDLYGENGIAVALELGGLSGHELKAL